MENVNRAHVVDVHELINTLHRQATSNDPELIPVTLSGSIVSFDDPIGDLSLRKCLVNIEPVQSGSGDPSPSNIRPISGWSAIKVSATGLNIWDEEWEKGGIILSTGENYANTKRWRSDYIPVTPSTAYYCKSGDYILMFFYDINKGYLGNSSSTSLNIDFINKAFRMPNNAYYVRIASGVDGTGVYNNDTSVNYPPSETAYHVSTGAAYYPVSLGQTVYGGTLDVVTGVLTITHGYIESYAGETLPSVWISDRDVYAAGTTPTTGAQVVYELAEPVTVELTPTEITTLQGTNNVWADSGDITVTYVSYE